jgi:hypothetical protein
MHPSSFKSFKIDWKWWKYGFKIGEGLELFFQKNWSKLSFILFCVALLVMTFNEHLYLSSLCVQWHKNHSIWLRKEENIGKCLMINMCLVIGGFTLFLLFLILNIFSLSYVHTWGYHIFSGSIRKCTLDA